MAKSGKWIYASMDWAADDIRPRCSVCGAGVVPTLVQGLAIGREKLEEMTRYMRYCPQCGARLKGK